MTTTNHLGMLWPAPSNVKLGGSRTLFFFFNLIFFFVLKKIILRIFLSFHVKNEHVHSHVLFFCLIYDLWGFFFCQQLIYSLRELSVTDGSSCEQHVK
jgi:hypothetical protein